MTPEIHPELLAVLTEIEHPSLIDKRAVHDALRPISTLAAALFKQVIEHKRLIDDAMLVEHDPALDGYLERMHQTYGALERETLGLRDASRHLAQAMSQLERYGAEWRADCTRWLAEAGTPPEAEPTTATTPTQPGTRGATGAV